MHPFLLIGEPLAVDLVNTRTRRHGIDADLLDSPAALAAWLRVERARLAWKGAVDLDDLAAVCALRDVIADLLHAVRMGRRPPAAAVARLNRALSRGTAQQRLTWARGRPRLVAARARTQRDALLYALASDAATLLTGPDAARLRQCAHPDCILQFVARNPRRRWCSSALCGNRARVARHHLRQHEAQ